jgi:Leucine-rich repeat (LRR) protein
LKSKLLLIYILSRGELIDLATNQLTELDPSSFVDLPRFRDFTVGINKISQLQKNVVQFLKTKKISISLAVNRIETVHQEVFGGVTAEVVDINLRSNKLGFIPTDAFKGRRFLNVDLTHNAISHISLEFFDEVLVQHLNISYNRLV